MAAVPDADILGIGLRLPDGTQVPFKLNHKRPLSETVKEICEEHNISNWEAYTLAWLAPKHGFITEKNKKEIRNADFLKLTETAEKHARKILEKLNFGAESEKIQALKLLADLSLDLTFASEFIDIKGHQQLIYMVESGQYKGELLSLCLVSLLQLMEHCTISWEILSDKFVMQVASEINRKNVYDADIVETALAMLEFLAMNSSSLYKMVQKVITLPRVVSHLKFDKPGVQKNAIAFINALFMKSDSTMENISATLSNIHIKNIIYSKVICGQKVGSEMSHQLYVLQSLLLNLYETRKTEEMGLDDYDAVQKIAYLVDVVLNSEELETTSTVSRDSASEHSMVHRKLGFVNTLNPLEDFVRPPGKLALDNLVYFAKNHTEHFIRLLQQNNFMASQHICPLVPTAIRLTDLLCSILKIGDTPTEEGKTFYPMYFTHDHPFEELFSACIQVVNRTWRQMKAAQSDFSKVFGVVEEQIVRTLNGNPAPLSFSDFKVQIRELSYNKIVKIRQQEFMNRDELVKKTRPIKELQTFFAPEILEIVKRQRLRFLCEGTVFVQYNSKGSRKDRFWCCRLSPNHKAFHYGTCSENVKPAFEALPHKLPVVDILSLATGGKCPHVRDAKRNHKLPVSFAFSMLLVDDRESMNFVAPNEKIFCYWTDGINLLIGRAMRSQEAQKDLETLLEMKLKMQLLETQELDIPENPPPIPDDPPDYDFNTRFVSFSK